MNKRTGLWLLGVSCLTASPVVMALDQDDIKIGVQYKHYSYSETDDIGGNGAKRNSEIKTSQKTDYVGLTARYKDFIAFVTPALNESKNYGYTATTTLGTLNPTTGKTGTTTINTPFTFTRYRSEYDLGVGYYVKPSIAITVGVKVLQYDYDRGSANGFNNISSCQSKTTFQMIGLSGGYSFDNKVFIFGNGNVSVAGQRTEDCTWNITNGLKENSYTGTPKYMNAEFGVGYPISKAFTGTLGYRNLQSKQSIATVIGGGTSTAKLTGYSVGVSYAF